VWRRRDVLRLAARRWYYDSRCALSPAFRIVGQP
jgi:hypothetical protein